MNILQISASDILGGASIAAYRLACGLRSAGHDVNWLVGTCGSNDCRVERIKRYRYLEKSIQIVTTPLGFNDVCCLSSFAIPRHRFFTEADILQLHNLHGGFFNYLALPRLTRLKPTIITLHDMWSFTGHCAYSFNCERWRRKCGNCPDLNIYPAVKRDSTRAQMRLKECVYRRSSISAVAPSRWLTELARSSMLGKYSEVYHIPNGVDTDIYRPLNQAKARYALVLQRYKRFQ